MARMKFYCDAERCIECNGCVTACKNENDVPWGVNRRRSFHHRHQIFLRRSFLRRRLVFQRHGRI